MTASKRLGWREAQAASWTSTTSSADHSTPSPAATEAERSVPGHGVDNAEARGGRRDRARLLEIGGRRHDHDMVHGTNGERAAQGMPEQRLAVQ